MQSLKIPVEQLREGPIELDLDMDPREIELQDEDYTFNGRVTGRVVFNIVGHDVFAVGDMTVPAEGKCVRCLEPAQTVVNATVNETWIRGGAPDTDEGSDIEAIVNTYVGDFVEPTGVLRELIMAALPDRLYCREDCKGLCPGCGANLNTEPCHCPHEAGQDDQASDWKAKLKQLKSES
ncbi:MAG: DUF177 domain-containing protein [Candidatus Sumerlaeia bacterium]